MPKVDKSTIINAPAEAVWAILRDFNGHDRWHPPVDVSQIEKGYASDKVGCVRNFRLKDGGQLREQLLSLWDLEMAYSYCLLDTPIPLINYVSHVSLAPVTDGDLTFWRWSCSFMAPPGEEHELARMVGEDIYQTGFEAIREMIGQD